MAESKRSITIRQFDVANDLDVLLELLREYEACLSVDLEYQGFEDELAGLPGEYSRPIGSLLLAEIDGQIAGCVALRRLDENICEMKRLFALDKYRGAGVGRALVRAVIEDAISLGYSALMLDTLPEMAAAQKLYRSFGFEETEPYFHSEIEGNTFMRLDLASYDKKRVLKSAPRHP